MIITECPRTSTPPSSLHRPPRDPASAGGRRRVGQSGRQCGERDSVDLCARRVGPAVVLDPASVTVGLTGGSQPFSIIQPYEGMNNIICLEGIFPSRN